MHQHHPLKLYYGFSDLNVTTIISGRLKTLTGMMLFPNPLLTYMAELSLHMKAAGVFGKQSLVRGQQGRL